MEKITKIIVLIVIIIIIVYFYKQKSNHDMEESKKKENFKIDSQNWVYNNVFENAYKLDYGKNDDIQGIYKTQPQNPMGPSQDIGVNKNSSQDVFDNRGFKWTANAKDSQIDEFTKSVNDAQLRNKFERMYMLDPDGSVAKYDITYNKISPNCCPAQYAPPFKLTDKDSSNCDYAQKYVANQYSGMNFNDGYGCACITPKQADFFGSRGGNTD